MKISEVRDKGAKFRMAKWRIIIPPRMTGTGRRKVRFFKTKEEAERERDRFLLQQQHNRQMAMTPTIASDEMIHLIKIGDDELAAVQAFVEAVRKQAPIILAVRSFPK
jgi:hypothetical protein